MLGPGFGSWFLRAEPGEVARPYYGLAMVLYCGEFAEIKVKGTIQYAKRRTEIHVFSRGEF